MTASSLSFTVRCHSQVTIYSINMSSIFSRNSEAFASEFLEKCFLGTIYAAVTFLRYRRRGAVSGVLLRNLNNPVYSHYICAYIMS